MHNIRVTGRIKAAYSGIFVSDDAIDSMAEAAHPADGFPATIADLWAHDPEVDPLTHFL